jgi:hypothetical protein
MVVEARSLLPVALLTAQAEDSSRASSISGDLAVGNADGWAQAEAGAYDSCCVRVGLCRQRRALFVVQRNCERCGGAVDRW